MAYLGDNGLSKLWARMKAYINNRIANLEQGITEELIWQNASPTSSFEPQDVTIQNLTDYDFVEIEIYQDSTHVTSNLQVTTQKLKVEHDNRITLNANVQVGNYYMYDYGREMTIDTTNNKITFAKGVKHQCNKDGSTDDNTCAIPKAIYGIKGVK